ncbi:MAG: hypothetical protein MJ237_02240 [bacterium]|nr:hypothetical protein [bacterium]
MVYALKSYSNNQQYRRESSSAIDSLIRKISGEATSRYVVNDFNSKKSFLDKSVQKLAVNSIIEGNFPKENVVKQMAIKRVNKMLCIALGLLITVVIASYYLAISYEMKLNNLSKETVVLNNENSELQIKLDKLRSFNNVDQTLQKNNILQKAGEVVVTPEVVINSEKPVSRFKKKKLFEYAIGF